VADAPSLVTFKGRLDGALSNVIQLKMSLLTAGGLGWVASKGPFQLHLFYDSVINLEKTFCILFCFSSSLLLGMGNQSSTFYTILVRYNGKYLSPT